MTMPMPAPSYFGVDFADIALERRVCRACGLALPPEPVLDLGSQPLANNLLDAPDEPYPTVPLELLHCPDCGMVQLSRTVAPQVLFNHYLYMPGTSRFFQQHFSNLASLAAVILDLGPRDLVVDIGSNDGLFLSQLAGVCRILGVEPAANLASVAASREVPTVSAYWSTSTAVTLEKKYGKAKLITATNVFAHVNDPDDFLHGVKAMLTPRGVLVIEVPSLPVMLRSNTFDLVYHEHLSYWSLGAMDRLLARHSLQVVRAEEIPSHGGSYRVWVQREGEWDARVVAGSGGPTIWAEPPVTREDMQQFQGRVLAIRQGLWEAFTGAWRRQNGNVIGYGAPAKATVLLNYLRIGGGAIRYVVDDNPLKQGKWIPVADCDPVPVAGSERLEQGQAGTAIIFPWNLAAEIQEKLRGKVREVLIPLPQARIVQMEEEEHGEEGGQE